MVSTKAMKDLLVKLEWSGTAYGNTAACPSCPALFDEGKHRPGCALAALLIQFEKDAAWDKSDPVEFESVAGNVCELRMNIIGDGDTSCVAVMAEPHLTIATSLLQQASMHLMLASYLQAQANAAGPR